MTSTCRLRTPLLACLLVVATFAAYQPAWHGRFLWDDDSWTTLIDNLRHSVAGLRTMWTDPRALGQYYPLTASSFWLDYQLWGDWTLPYHLENIALHAAAALLFWRLLTRLRVPGAGLAAALFALHPVMVESVAWICERKNVLSLVFYLAALLCYARTVDDWSENPGEGNATSGRRMLWYLAAGACFVAALTAKVTACSLPAAVLLLGWWKRGRLQWRRDLVPVLPFFALAGVFAATVSVLERNHLGAQGANFSLTVAQRFLLAGRVFWFYAGKLLWPVHQSFIYPRWQLDPAAWGQWLYPIAAIAFVLGAWITRHRLGRGPLTAIFFYAGTLFPVLGFFNAYYMLYSFVWDHLTYLSSLACFTLAGAGIARVATLRAERWVPVAAMALLLPLLAALTWRQSAAYQDAATLYETTIRQNPDAWLAYGNLGAERVAAGQLDAGIALYEHALALHPFNPEAENNLANALAREGKLEPAVAHYRAALVCDPRMPAVQGNFATVLAELGRLDEAIVHFRLAAQTGHDRPAALARLAAALHEDGQDREAAARYLQALSLRPADAGVANDFALLLATSADAAVRNPPQALRLADRLTSGAGGRDPLRLRTAAAAQAAAERLPEAITTAQAGLDLAVRRGDEAVAALLRGDLAVYTAGQPLIVGRSL
jgi:tetratricopeptide (TPR) repeat protein